MNEVDESCVEDRIELQGQKARVVEYEKKLQQSARQPVFAAMFLLYLLTSVSVLSLVGYWLFW